MKVRPSQHPHRPGLGLGRRVLLAWLCASLLWLGTWGAVHRAAHPHAHEALAEWAGGHQHAAHGDCQGHGLHAIMDALLGHGAEETSCSEWAQASGFSGIESPDLASPPQAPATAPATGIQHFSPARPTHLNPPPRGPPRAA